MAAVTISITDLPDGNIRIESDFGDAVDSTSQAHLTADSILQAYFSASETVHTLEDTTGGAPVEKSNILLPKTNWHSPD